VSRPPTLLQQVAAIQELGAAELVDRYREVFGEAPRTRQPAWLRSRIAWRLQADAAGGLSPAATRRLDALISEIRLPTGDDAAPRTERAKLPRDPRRPRIGTLLTREWRGGELRVVVVEGGFEHEGVVYKSLSAVAKAVTGAHWSGNLFFGVTSRRKKR
jgi:hypothetical protein